MASAKTTARQTEEEEKVKAAKAKEEEAARLKAGEEEASIVGGDSPMKKERDKKCKCNPNKSKWWVRSCDAKQTAYYYNVRTGESKWLSLCGVCELPAKRWCITCKGAYCEADFSKYHDNTEWWNHKWSHQEPCKRAVLEPGEVYCKECGIVAATKMCTDCWDPFCKPCFKAVHSVGILQTHTKKDYAKTVAGWLPVKDKTTKGGEYFVNGTTGISTYAKPMELMTPTELACKKGYDKLSATLKAQIAQCEELQFNVEEVSYECANASVELDKVTKVNNKRLELAAKLAK